MAKNNLELTSASFASPAFIDKKNPGGGPDYHYFFNGEVVYSYEAKSRIFTQLELDPDTLKIKPYGLADANRVAVANRTFQVKPSKFKRVGKYDHYYFIKEGQVYRPGWSDMSLQPLPDMDAASLKVIDEFIAEDANYVYFRGRDTGIAKDRLGPYFATLSSGIMVVLGQKGVFFLDQFIDVDAETFKVVKTFPKGKSYCFFQAQDKNGDIWISINVSPAFNGESRLTLLRGENAQAEAEATMAADQQPPVESTLIPGDFNQGLQANLARLNLWLTTDFASKWSQNKSNLQLYRLINAYLAWCVEAYQADKNDDYLVQGIAQFEAISIYSWLHPELLHNAARLYVLAGEWDKALLSCQQAMHFRYQKFADIFTDPVLQPLKKLTEFESLSLAFKKLGKHFAHISLPLLDACENAVQHAQDDSQFATWLRGNILYKYDFYKYSELTALVESTQGGEAAMWQALAEKNHFYFQHYMLLEGPEEAISDEGQRQWQYFLLYHEYQQLNPLVYIRMANILFCEAHSWSSWKYDHFEDNRQVLAPRIKEASQLIGYFQQLFPQIKADEQQSLLTAAQKYGVVQMMQISGKSLIQKGL